MTGTETLRRRVDRLELDMDGSMEAGVMDFTTVAEVLQDPEWLELEPAVLRSLEPFPDALAALVEVLERLRSGPALDCGSYRGSGWYTAVAEMANALAPYIDARIALAADLKTERDRPAGEGAA